ncbi:MULTISPECIES: BadF/BadG/BcrA/BcrD ATPase family protein [unclassified Chelatococcus]|uniref:BadF/BadG/BcrA/BcrD ATPase family protein n=1 Tax=unclassified Chelatococcus TaxID=2638111 RepID=UPI001BD0C124|nr:MULTISPECIES: BadF/BadG/BcrA/BcrD ATPase family protein [unclassified Chelatococcus]MBS7697997.1 N-acetylglucosamine kinase [Chelatococcus sp. YT9]MBX3556685.1 N-acetylglucosamine kinase [Chelatococcus sp.]
MTDALFIGVDGGGTHCRARIRDAKGQLIGEGRGGPANVRLGPDRVMASILDAAREAARAGGLPDDAFPRMHAGLGLAGAAQSKPLALLKALPHPFASVSVDTDAYVAWLGATHGADGAILILGTGSCGFAVVRGVRHSVGGYGSIVSDGGSGAVIGREGIRRAVLAFDQLGPRSALTDELLGAFGNSAEAIVDWADAATPGDFASHTPTIIAHASAGDPVASAIVTAAAGDADALIARLVALRAPTVALLGGLAGPLLPWLSPQSRHHVVTPIADAIDGAILMARQHARPSWDGAALQDDLSPGTRP